MASKNRESRMLQLTTAELNGLPSEANVYEGVGKMCVYLHLACTYKRLRADGATG